jgi:hypothetical protein
VAAEQLAVDELARVAEVEQHEVGRLLAELAVDDGSGLPLLERLAPPPAFTGSAIDGGAS